MHRKLLFVLACCSLLACAASPHASAPPPNDFGPEAAAAAEPPPLERSLFARTAQGSLSEEDLQAVLDRPLELDLPGRVGVLPIIEAADWRGPSPSYEMVSPALSKFAKKLPSDDGFASVTEMMPIPSGALGMEALREVAARYKLRYLVLYREHVDASKRANGIAAGYASVVGTLFLPGSTLEVEGYAEASLFDVKTGLLLFTVRKRLETSKRSTVWQRERKLEEMREAIAIETAASLADETRTALIALQGSVDEAPQQDRVRAPAPGKDARARGTSEGEPDTDETRPQQAAPQSGLAATHVLSQAVVQQ